MTLAKHHLPKELTQLVNFALDLLGQATLLQNGKQVFNEVEYIRQQYKNVRTSQTDKRMQLHRKIDARIKKHSPEDLISIAHCFAVSLELINLCESAYRSHRLAQKKYENTGKQLEPIFFVLTAHPTEARSPKVVRLLDKISHLLRKRIDSGELTQLEHNDLNHLIHLLVRTPISKSKSPSVQDEAEYIYSTLLKPDNINVLCDYYDQGRPVFIRTWVGGDKDGHPGINDKVMLSSLKASRAQLVPIARNYVEQGLSQLDLLENSTENISQIKSDLGSLSTSLLQLKNLDADDGQKVSSFYKELVRIQENYSKYLCVRSPSLDRLNSLFMVFPALLVPLELREDSAVIKEALMDTEKPIAKMIRAIQKISRGGKAEWYARGLVISMCESAEDVKNAASLLKEHLTSLELPIVPLYETKLALENSREITNEFLKDSSIKKAITDLWDGKLEIMLGYSDSAKESGALYSRVVIHKTLQKLDRFIKSQNLTPVFFHGSGGSVARGGGSLSQQISWWPKSARLRFKATIQGEMIHRTFSTPEILKRQVEKIRSSVSEVSTEKTDTSLIRSIRDFAEEVRLKYMECVNDDQFMQMVQLATPYPYLDKLKIGSRPSKRKVGLSLKSLRAIPWVLCWTQTRIHFPVWWGIGSVWKASTTAEKAKLKKAFKKSSLMSSFVSVLAYTLAKVDMSVWSYFLETSSLPKEEAQKYLKAFEQEFKLTKSFVAEVTGQNKLVWFSPWLEESIRLRTTMIYPLNILEVHALKTDDIPLLRETVTGVASGMLTTG